jgi:ferric-dicitrate binding protein FerR (iron transport regulator)
MDERMTKTREAEIRERAALWSTSVMSEPKDSAIARDCAELLAELDATRAELATCRKLYDEIADAVMAMDVRPRRADGGG